MKLPFKRPPSKPMSAAHTKLGGCIRDVLQVVAFPTALDEKEVAISLALYR